MTSQIIPADSSLPVRTVTPKDGKKFTLEELQGFVGGFIEHVPYKGGHIWLNEEGKLNGLPRNERATKLALLARSIFADDFIVGDVLIQTKGERGLPI